MIQHHHNLQPHFSHQWSGDTSTPPFRRNSPITYQPEGLNHITACRTRQIQRSKLIQMPLSFSSSFGYRLYRWQWVCSRSPRAHRVDTVFHSKQSLSAIKVLANGDLLVNRITESEKQRVWTKAVYPPPTKKSWRPQQAGILLIDVTATVWILTYFTVLVYSGGFCNITFPAHVSEWSSVFCRRLIERGTICASLFLAKVVWLQRAVTVGTLHHIKKDMHC